jgi:hypothetical protein
MTRRFAILVVAVLGMSLVLNRPVLSADKTHEGKVVSATEGKDKADGKLVMTDNDGKNEKTHSIPSTAKITVNGKAGKLSEVKKGDTVKVTVDDKSKVTAVAVTRS